jgi:hypothetical protein
VWGPRADEYHRVFTAGVALVPNYALGVWLYFWAVSFFLGKRKAVGTANWKAVYQKKIIILKV